MKNLDKVCHHGMAMNGTESQLFEVFKNALIDRNLKTGRLR